MNIQFELFKFFISNIEKWNSYFQKFSIVQMKLQISGFKCWKYQISNFESSKGKMFEFSSLIISVFYTKNQKANGEM